MGSRLAVRTDVCCCRGRRCNVVDVVTVTSLIVVAVSPVDAASYPTTYLANSTPQLCRATLLSRVRIKSIELFKSIQILMPVFGI